MQRTVTVSLARPGDGRAIVRIIRDGFPRKLLRTTVYGCRGMANYVEDQIQLASEFSDTTYLVAEMQGNIAGCAEFRRFPAELWLNYVAVDARYRGRGIALRMLSFGLRELRVVGQRRLTLDVLGANLVPRRWYERLGLKPLSSTHLLEIPLPQIGRRQNVFVSGYPQAATCHKRYGFSEFQVTTAEGEYSVGRIGRQYFRLRQAVALENQTFLSFLASIDPGRRVLYTSPDHGKSGDVPVGVASIAVFLHMSAPIDAVNDRLRVSE
ncbi:MAG: hypothetical protein A3H94_01435 [Acidobacteria bacterium RIFCSPLOWO2_02_FULL_60_20]|nr:MAG: hypothetical protein A3H94_01435 [Acidobacteria bacterium RIFCSPLOWO2_02_FULL_60_20]